jgi:hypothetical protein
MYSSNNEEKSTREEEDLGIMIWTGKYAYKLTTRGTFPRAQSVNA